MKELSILYEDDEILLVNKPVDVSVQGGVGIAHPLDVELSNQVGYKVHLVHRLDKDTAGILIVAKNSKSATKWINLISTAAVKKEYVALCIGKPIVKGREADSGIIKSVVEAHGRKQDAELSFKLRENFTASIEVGEEKISIPMSLLSVTLGTGRMHQIRIQLAQANAPLAADDQHGDFKKNKLLRKIGIRKLQLCAYRLTLPINGKNTTFEIKFPSHIQKSLDNLRNSGI